MFNVSRYEIDIATEMLKRKIKFIPQKQFDIYNVDRIGNGIFEVVVTGIRNEMEEELDEREGYMKMKELKPGATIEDLEEFLLYHMDEADDRRSRINPALTKRDVWNINMGVVIEGQITKVVDLAIKNATREFGSLYEGI